MSKTQKAKLKNLLGSLGDTPSEIAANLHKRSVKGIPCQIDSCPVANLVKAELGCTEVFADTDSIDIRADDELVASVKPPNALQEFMVMFDNGKYSFLALGDEEYAEDVEAQDPQSR